MNNISTLIPFWNQLTKSQQEFIIENASFKSYSAGKNLKDSSEDCSGLMIVKSGCLRVFILSPTGKEITLYRLFERDICLLSASCLLKNIQFDVFIEVAVDTELYFIPTAIYQKLTEESLVASNFTNELLASKFSEVMWLMEQILFKSMDERLAIFLLEESQLQDTKNLKITQDKIAKHIGTAREVITRLLKYFQTEGYIKINRGVIEILDEDRLIELQEKNN